MEELDLMSILKNMIKLNLECGNFKKPRLEKLSDIKNTVVNFHNV